LVVSAVMEHNRGVGPAASGGGLLIRPGVPGVSLIAKPRNRQSILNAKEMSHFRT
jgi:hypothetical protein